MEIGSYLLIQPGMTVRGSDGDLGKVAEVVADPGVDIFRGIVLAHGFLAGKHGFISEELVLSVEQSIVSVRLTKTEADDLPAPREGGQAYEGRDLLL